MWDFLAAGGPFMALLVLTSVVSLTFIVERGIALRRSSVVPKSVEDAMENCHSKEHLDALQATCKKYPSALARLVLAAIDHLPWPKADNQNSLETRARHEVVNLERGLVILEVIVGIAPLLGLVGTVHGLITLFGSLGKSALSDSAVLSKGIAIALNTTLMGLLIAIPSLIAWSYYTKKVESLAVEMETLLDDLLRRQYRAKKGKSGTDDRGGSTE